MEKSRVIYGNPISRKHYSQAVRNQKSYVRKYGDDRQAVYHLQATDNAVLTPVMGVKNLSIGGDGLGQLPEKSLIVGNIRMGFGHYRISMAIASAAHALGYTPFWFDLNGFRQSSCGKIIESQNQLYSLGSRVSQASRLFNKLVWEPMNYEGFRQLSYNAKDQKTAELMTAVYRELPKDVPFVATHAWPAQAAIHAGLTNVVNAIPDNWQMALHLSEGVIHTVQSPSAFLGYKTLRGMEKDKILKPMPAGSIVYTGHYIDHELVRNIEHDCALRVQRAENGGPRRYLLSVGGAGAQKEIFTGIIRALLPQIRQEKAVLFLNFGDHEGLMNRMVAEIPELKEAVSYINDYTAASRFALSAIDGEARGIHIFCDREIFAAVYITNLLMRACDVLITKPSELAYYPVPKLLIKRVGGHEAWGAIRSAEVGDGTFECEKLDQVIAMTKLMQEDPSVLTHMCGCILNAHQAGLYHGAYKVVRLAAGECME